MVSLELLERLELLDTRPNTHNTTFIEVLHVLIAEPIGLLFILAPAYNQCCGSGMFIPDGSEFLRPRS
jgi:hypothetical protein